MNWSKRCIFFVGYLIHFISAWDYKDPDLWKDGYPECDGMYQSPINLDELTQVFDYQEDLSFMNYDQSPSSWTIKNNGHTVEITGNWKDSTVPSIIKDGFEYQFMQMHFHWGPTDDSGSEHIYNNKLTPLELHMVHWDTTLGDFDPKEGEGILVLAVLYELSSEETDYMWDLVEFISEIQDPESEYSRVKAFPLSSVISQTGSENYLTYIGSLTTPPCSEGVSWVILEALSPVSEDQMELVRMVELEHDDDHNNRPVQHNSQRELTVISS